MQEWKELFYMAVACLVIGGSAFALGQYTRSQDYAKQVEQQVNLLEDL